MQDFKCGWISHLLYNVKYNTLEEKNFTVVSTTHNNIKPKICIIQYTNCLSKINLIYYNLIEWPRYYVRRGGKCPSSPDIYTFIRSKSYSQSINN